MRRLATLSAAPPPRPWNVGFIGGVVAPVAMDSIESLSHNDSATLTIGVTRLASALPNDTRRPILRTSVRRALRVAVRDSSRSAGRRRDARASDQSGGDAAAGADVPRRRTLADRQHAVDRVLERSYGDEETVESREVLAAILLGGSRNAAIVLSHDFGNATAYAIIERGDDGRWRARWKSPRRRC